VNLYYGDNWDTPIGENVTRYPGETNLHNSVARFSYMVESEYLQGGYGTPTGMSLAAQADYQGALQQRIDNLNVLVLDVPAWRNFSAMRRASISAQTGTFIQNLIPGPDFTQNTVLLWDPATTTWGDCADPSLEAATMAEGGTPCEAEFLSDCFTISMPSNRNWQTQNWVRTFGCEDFFYALQQAVDQVTLVLVEIDAALNLNTEGEVGLAELGEAVLDEVVTTKAGVTDEGAKVIVPWFAFAIAGAVGLLAWRGLRA
jgi:hypothetical protein